MQRTIWEWLGIGKTTDKSRIRKAYAEQVKRYHPEEFPQEAQELREAYKSAMAQASDTRSASGWAEDNIAQEISSAVRDSGRVLPEFSHFESQAESDAGTKPKYGYPKTVPPGGQSGPESKSEPEPEYTYQKPVPLDGQSGPESEPKYIYQKPVSPGEQSGPESEHTYQKPVPPGTQSETDSEGESEWVYRKSVPPGTQSETDLEPEYVYRSCIPPDEQAEREYSFASPELPHAVAIRIADMKKRMGDIYGTEHRNSAEKWRQVFADYPEPGDLRDVRAV